MEPIKTAIAIPLSEETHVAAARRATAEFCRRLNLSDPLIARAELVAVELGGNILHHAQRGQLFIVPVPDRPSSVRLIASDAGPGIADPERAFEAGFSTHTTPGLGLGAVRKKSDALDLYTRRGAGTVVVATLSDNPAYQDPLTAVLSTQFEGETRNGDSWAVYNLPGRRVWMVVDGLGHGEYAAQASALAISVADRSFSADPHLGIPALIQRMHVPMQATRGAAVLMVVDTGRKLVCCGIGNISAVLCQPNGTSHNLVSHNGTVGHRMARVQEFEYSYSPESLLVLHSDGISTRWRLSQYPGLFEKSPAAVAGVLYRDAVRSRDDATILVARLSDTLDFVADSHGESRLG
jgi:anti-sigma regulatory factor (Ser/Thr protein kinase)